MTKPSLFLLSSFALTLALSTVATPGGFAPRTAEAAMAAHGASAAGNAANGKKLYAANCAGCHGATGTEGGAGPSLKGEKSKKNLAAVVAWIKKPAPPMPKLYPSPLSEKNVRDVAAYVEKL